ncbi:MAG: choice-of-anchor V domain-containing protein, partial [Gemmatimonadota bacterium]
PPPPPRGVRIAGLPDRFAPGRSYELSVALQGTPTRAAGFQLTVRGAPGSATAGQQAGNVAPIDGRTRVRLEEGVQYLGHTYDGMLQASQDSARWRFRWTAPTDASEVVFHTAANFANDDASELGDEIRTGSWSLRTAEKEHARGVR